MQLKFQPICKRNEKSLNKFPSIVNQSFCMISTKRPYTIFPEQHGQWLWKQRIKIYRQIVPLVRYFVSFYDSQEIDFYNTFFRFDFKYIASFFGCGYSYVYHVQFSERGGKSLILIVPLGSISCIIYLKKYKNVFQYICK